MRNECIMKRIINLIVLVLLLSSCGNEYESVPASLLNSIPTNRYYNNEILSVPNLTLYGSWQFLNIYDYAGIASGRGKLNPNYDYLVIKKFGIYGKIKDNKLIESGMIQIIKQDNTTFEVNFIPNNNDTNGLQYWYISFTPKDSVTLTDASIFCGTLYNVYKRKN